MKVRRTLALAVRPGLGNAAWHEEDAALMQRVELVLSTPQKTVPWRPEFGCGIWAMLGQPATPTQLVLVRRKIEEALARWVPLVRVHQCDVTLVPEIHQADAAAVRGAKLPPLEMGLLHLGVTASLRVDLSLGLNDGTIQVRFDFGA